MSDAPTGARFEPLVARLHMLHPRLIDLNLGRVQRLLDALGNPERRLPPVIHVAGTNGKGSTCAFLRAIAEAAGRRVHVFTSPHLVRFNERIRLAGALVSDAALEDALARAEQVNAGQPITVFEMVTAAAFLLFAATPADLLALEVGLGGRGDATNVVPAPAACAITHISMDHREFLGDTLAAIAAEKAGIIKPGVPVVTGRQAPEVLAVLRAAAARSGAPLLARDEAWTLSPDGAGLRYRDAAATLDLPAPSLPGRHQHDNAGIAVAALRASGLAPDAACIARGIARAVWPARLQRLSGRLAGSLPPGWELWLDGGHNAGAGEILGEHVKSWHDRPLVLVVGMKNSKDAEAFLRPLLPHATRIFAVAEPGQHMAMPIAAVIAASHGVAVPGPTVSAALARIGATPPGRVLICGSLFLAGEVLKADDPNEGGRHGG
jgi:dihydrofolate synthase/folylpolyglutamate synthase